MYQLKTYDLNEIPEKIYTRKSIRWYFNEIILEAETEQDIKFYTGLAKAASLGSVSAKQFIIISEMMLEHGEDPEEHFYIVKERSQ